MIILHLANVALVLIFCILYPSPYHGYGMRLMAWMSGLTSLTLFTSGQSAPMPEYYTRMKHIIMALGTWSLSVFFCGMYLHDHSLLLAGIALIFSLYILALLHSRGLSRELFYLALILRGEPEYLEDVERYIKETGVYNNRVELIEPIYTTEHLSIVDESKWYSSTEFKKERPLSQLRKKRSNHEHITFSCLLHGELRYMAPIWSFIADYLSDWKIQTRDYVYSLERLHIVKKN
ncbi:MAG: hypothetical protein HXS52_05740 [Theionarchaea archaeon]|nr:hypothetical protein [Theionarchaea archaeon]